MQFYDVSRVVHALERSRDDVEPGAVGLGRTKAVSGPTIAHCTAVKAVSMSR